MAMTGHCVSQRDSRRVKSTGDEAEPEANLSQPVQRRREGVEREESSIFYAKPVRVHKHRPMHRVAARNAGKSMGGRFKGCVLDKFTP